MVMYFAGAAVAQEERRAVAAAARLPGSPNSLRRPRANLASDRFLIERLGADGLGAIPVALIASFPRVAALTDDLTRVTAAMAAIPGLAVYLSVDGSPWVHRLTPIEWGGW